MSDRLSLSIFTIEVDGKPTLAFEAKRYSEAEAICGDEELRAKLSLLKSGNVTICGDNALLDVRLARSDEAAFYRHAADASQSNDDLLLVYLVELDEPEDQHT
jgi:riboflavin biosynthesis pyrimidine reductase